MHQARPDMSCGKNASVSGQESKRRLRKENPRKESLRMENLRKESLRKERFF